MQAEKFVASDVSEALRLVKNKFGKNAIVLSSKKVRKGTGSFGFFGKEMVEITATQDFSEKDQPPSSFQNKNLSQPNSLQDVKANRLNYNRFHRHNSSELHQSNHPELLKTSWKKDAVQEDLSEVKDILAEMKQKFNHTKNEGGQIQHMRQEIQELKGMIHGLLNGKESHPKADWNENLTALYQQMHFNGVEEKFAKRLIEELKSKVSGANLEDYEYLKLYTARIFLQAIAVKDLFEAAQPQKPSIFCFVGVTGVGKTTTIAKIASHCKLLKPDKKLGLITLDNFRIGAVEQLKEYAKIIRVPFRSAVSAEDLSYALKSLSSCDYIFIDTPGASQRDEEKISELFEATKEVANMHPILVLNATTRDSEMNEITKRFSAFPFSGCVFTKLDEATTYGSILNHLIRFKLPVYFLTTGQNVPDDIEIAKPERLIDLVLNLAE